MHYLIESLQHLYKVVITITLILWRKKLRLGEIKQEKK